MNYIKQNDILIGEMNEDLIQLYFEEKFNVKLIRTAQFNEMDFIDENKTFYLEIKSRNINHNKYYSTMIGYNKIQYAEKKKKDVYFIFAFTDGNYYYKYNNKDNFDVQIGGRKDRGCAEYKKYYFIPVHKLTKMI